MSLDQFSEILKFLSQNPRFQLDAKYSPLDSSSDSVISSSVKIHEAAKEAAKAVEKSNENVHDMVNDVESTLKEHEERLTGQLIATGAAVAVFVPLVSYIINKFL